MDEEKKGISKSKKHFIVHVQKQTDDYLYFQMSRGGEAAEPMTPDPDEEWTKRQWERAMFRWRSQLRQWGRPAGSEEERVEEANVEEDRAAFRSGRFDTHAEREEEESKEKVQS